MEANRQWPLPDGVNQLLDEAAVVLDAMLIEPPREFRDPDQQIWRNWLRNQQEALRVMQQELNKMRYAERKLELIEQVNRFYQREGEYLTGMQEYLIREQQRLVTEEVVGAIQRAPNEDDEEINLHIFFRAANHRDRIDRQRRAQHEREQILRNQRQERLEIDGGDYRWLFQEPEQAMLQVFGPATLDRHQQEFVVDLTKEMDIYAGKLWLPGKVPESIQSRPFFRPHNIKIKHQSHSFISQYFARKTPEADENLIAYLHQEAMFLPRTPALALMLKEKARRWIEEFDTTKITRQQQTDIIGNAVNAAMLPTKHEIDFVHAQENIINRITVHRHNQHFSIGDKVLPTVFGPPYSSSLRTAMELTKIGLSLSLMYCLVAKPDALIKTVDLSHVILNRSATRLRSTIVAYATKWLPFGTGI